MAKVEQRHRDMAATWAGDRGDWADEHVRKVSIRLRAEAIADTEARIVAWLLANGNHMAADDIERGAWMNDGD